MPVCCAGDARAVFTMAVCCAGDARVVFTMAVSRNDDPQNGVIRMQEQKDPSARKTLKAWLKAYLKVYLKA